MKETMMRLVKEIGRILLVCLGILLVLLLITLVLAGIYQAGILDVYWRLCAGIGALAMLMAAVLLLTNKAAKDRKMNAWQRAFPHVSFTAAILILGTVLVLCAGLFNGICVR